MEGNCKDKTEVKPGTSSVPVMNLRTFIIIGQGPDSSYEHLALRKEFGYDFLTLDSV